MDQNLTGIAILAGPLSAGIGALAVYYASKRTQDAQLRIEEIKGSSLISVGSQVSLYTNSY
jgi:hypothetical protein